MGNEVVRGNQSYHEKRIPWLFIEIQS